MLRCRLGSISWIDNRLNQGRPNAQRMAPEHHSKLKAKTYTQNQCMLPLGVCAVLTHTHIHTGDRPLGKSLQRVCVDCLDFQHGLTWQSKWSQTTIDRLLSFATGLNALLLTLCIFVFVTQAIRCLRFDKLSKCIFYANNSHSCLVQAFSELCTYKKYDKNKPKAPPPPPPHSILERSKMLVTIVFRAYSHAIFTLILFVSLMYVTSRTNIHTMWLGRKIEYSTNLSE